MTFSSFLESTKQDESPPSDVSPELKSLWFTKVGEWENAHNIAQDIPSRMGSWIHGLLHAIEGDMGNAGYWFHKANETPIAKSQIDSEWERIVRDCLESSDD